MRQQPLVSWAVKAFDQIGLFMRDMGGAMHRFVSAAFHRSDLVEDSDVQDQLLMCLGPLPRVSMSQTAEAQFLGQPRRSAANVAERLASTVHFGTRAFAGGVCSHIAYLIAGSSPTLQPIAVITTSAYDETPLPFSVEDMFSLAREFPDTAEKLVPLTTGAARASYLQASGLDQIVDNAAAAVNDATAAGKCKLAKKMVKVLQSDQALIFVCKVIATGHFLSIRVGLTAPLQYADSCTGEVLARFWKEQMHVPGLDELRKLFPLNIDQVNTDKGSSNIRCERSAQNQSRPMTQRLSFPCDVHNMSTAQGSAYTPVSDTVSQVLSLALAQRQGQSTGVFRGELVAVVEARARVFQANPPDARHPDMLYRDRIFDVFLPSTTLSNDMRKTKLKALMQGNMLDKSIAVYTKDEHFNVHKWAEAVGWLLFPHAIVKFSRGRWLTSTESIQGCGLLACTHRLLEIVIPRWVKVLYKKHPGPVPQSASIGIGDWCMSDSDGDGEDTRGVGLSHI
jgi:hypothetical protein